MRKSLTFNGINKPWLYLLEGRSKAPFAPMKNKLLTVPGMPGAHNTGTETSVLYITQPIGFIVKNDEHALQLKDELAEWLITDKPVPLELDDEPGRTYYAKIEGSIEDFNRFVDQRKGTITFVCPDPFKYGEEITHNFPSDIELIEAEGTADSDPIFELEVLEPVTFAMVANENDEYNLIGIPTDVDEEVVDTKQRVLYERGETLGDGWTDGGTQFDNGAVTGGQLGTDGTGIHPERYGDPPKNYEGWYGPALMKEITPIQDFEIEMRLRANTNAPDQLYRIECYFYDENMEVLGKIAIRDFSLTMERYAAEGRIGEFKGAGKNYLISQENYLREASHFHGLVRVRREGERFEFYAARLKTGSGKEGEGKHHDTITKVFYDTGREYQGRLKHVQINIARHTKGASASVPRINALNVYELSQVEVDQTPYIAHPGDEITLDHKENDILINGETIFGEGNMPVEKNFGADFFKLKKGLNNLIVHPSDSFKTKLKYRPRYR